MWGKKTKIALVLSSVVLAVVGAIVIWYTGNVVKNSVAGRTLTMAKMVEAALPQNSISNLSVDVSDLEKPEYRNIKTNLMNIAGANPSVRFAYIYTQKEGKIFFVADSEPADSVNYSPPGQEYVEAADEYYKPFSDGQSLITKPVTDRWGEWVSILVPIKDPATGNILAVFGIDYPANEWGKEVLFRTVQVGIVVVVLLLLLFSLFKIVNNGMKIRESEKNFRSFFESAGDIIIVGNKQGKIIYTSSAVSKKLGYTQKELRQMRIVDINQKTKRAEAEQIFSEMLAGKRDSCSLPLERKNGTLIPSETRVWSGKWGGEDCVFGISKDLSIEQESLQKFNKIFDNNPTITVISSATNRKLVDVNQAFSQKIGYTKNEAVEKTAEELKLFVQPETQQLIFENLKNKGFIHNIDAKIKTKSGEVLDGIYFGEIIESQGEKFFLSVLVDQTDRKRIEAEMMKKNVELEKLNTFMVNREIKMAELKKEIEKLKGA